MSNSYSPALRIKKIFYFVCETKNQHCLFLERTHFKAKGLRQIFYRKPFFIGKILKNQGFSKVLTASTLSLGMVKDRL